MGWSDGAGSAAFGGLEEAVSLEMREIDADQKCFEQYSDLFYVRPCYSSVGGASVGEASEGLLVGKWW